MSEETQEKMNLYQKLAKIRKGTEVIQKNKAGYGYKYTSIEEILSYVTAGMNKYGVSLVPRINTESSMSVDPYTYTKIKTTKSGERYEEPITEFLAKATVVYSWIDNDDPSVTIDIPWFITGSQTDPSQALGSALTYGLRYFLIQYFQIATPEDDPDEWRSKQREAEAAEDKAVSQKLIQEFDTAIRTYLADNPAKAEDVKKFVSKFVKSGDYKKIVEPTLAAKLLEDFKNTFLNGGK